MSVSRLSCNLFTQLAAQFAQTFVLGSKGEIPVQQNPGSQSWFSVQTPYSRQRSQELYPPQSTSLSIPSFAPFSHDKSLLHSLHTFWYIFPIPVVLIEGLLLAHPQHCPSRHSSSDSHTLKQESDMLGHEPPQSIPNSLPSKMPLLQKFSHDWQGPPQSTPTSVASRSPLKQELSQGVQKSPAEPKTRGPKYLQQELSSQSESAEHVEAIKSGSQRLAQELPPQSIPVSPGSLMPLKHVGGS
jgi:hypothetical protein